MADVGSIYIKYGSPATAMYLGVVTSFSSASKASLFDIDPPALGLSGESQSVRTIITAPKTYVDIDVVLDCTKLGYNFYQCVDYLRGYQRFYAQKNAWGFADFVCIQLTQSKGWWFALAVSNFEFKAYPGKPTLISIGIAGERSGGEGYVGDCSVISSSNVSW